MILGLDPTGIVLVVLTLLLSIVTFSGPQDDGAGGRRAPARVLRLHRPGVLSLEWRRAATQTSCTLQALQRVTDAALGYLPLEELLTSCWTASPDPQHRHGGVPAAGRGDGRWSRPPPRASRRRSSRACGSRSGAASRADRGRAPADRDRRRRPRRHPQPDPAREGHPLAARRAAAGRGPVIGVLHVGTLAPRVFTDADRDLLQLAADRAALAIERAGCTSSAASSRRSSERCCRRSCRGPGLELAARYRPAASRRHRRRLVRRLHARPRGARAGRSATSWATAWPRPR